MKIHVMKYTLLLSTIVLLLTGCTSSMMERQGTKAYLEKDYATAKMKYDEAIVEGNADAMYHLAVMYAEGQGVQQDYAKAASLLEQAVAQEQEDAQLMLGLFNIYGDGVPKDPAKGAELIKASAVNGNDTAMYYLGNLYAAGLGVQKDLTQALHWMEQAKKAGFPVKDELLTKDGLAALYQ
ncbi:MULTISPECIES: tetratricopeptide repeat protein [unclassified Pseudodesulfovibrio]|uniref:tetratricopeptide repeat protein n=1 Tax=unclassified Pseudodesulfovibrio TaxID=2661612 RepID=UPI000FEC0AB6|nr:MULTISPECIES: tetratricopeptide repeat protein [unclassified Pseudodesulfovibrio]MCJ2164978.1 sel1 repeat family protein [Pseudodesulfovibrio sp. S3-i]RWU03579.1 sel1 repeat family protein [Pseudodesulfovibrio sp. S3]